MVVALFLVPALAGIAAFFIRPHGPRRALLPAVAVAHASLTSLAWLGLPAPALQGLLKLDELGLLFLSITSALFLVASFYAVGYLKRETPDRRPDFEQGFLFDNIPEAVFIGWSRQTSAVIEPGVTDHFRMEGEEIHEVAVGPVHAGIIEPGHFRFQCHGEDVYHLEISLGYQHRGVERALTGSPGPRTNHYAETLAGDTSIGHATACSELLEALSEIRVPARAQIIRGIALELERLANHTGDLGALAGDVGFLPTASYCGRIRGDFLNMTALICGSRFGRGLVRPGGVAFDLEDARRAQLMERLDAARQDVTTAVDLLWDSPSVLARFQETGRVDRKTAVDLGLVGVAARACDIERDVRHEFPTGIYRLAHIPVSMAEAGDVFARAFVRWLEIQRSLAFIQDQLRSLPPGENRAAAKPPGPSRIAVSLVEGWRGEICHMAMTDEAGRLAAYKIVDPSFHNWMGLAIALRDQQISDFPLCNKSFNLSYCGHDL